MVKFNKFEEIFFKGTLRDFFAYFFFFKNWTPLPPGPL